MIRLMLWFRLCYIIYILIYVYVKCIDRFKKIFKLIGLNVDLIYKYWNMICLSKWMEFIIVMICNLM